MSRTERDDQRLRPSACAASSSGSNSKRSCVRPKGNCSVSTTSGASARNSSSSRRVRAVAEGVVERRAVERGAARAGSRRARAPAAADGSARRRDRGRDRRAARDQQHVEAAGRQRARQDGGAAQMADAQQVLHIEEDARS